jgi:hypothetical protein
MRSSAVSLVSRRPISGRCRVALQRVARAFHAVATVPQAGSASYQSRCCASSATCCRKSSRPFRWRISTPLAAHSQCAAVPAWVHAVRPIRSWVPRGAAVQRCAALQLKCGALRCWRVPSIAVLRRRAGCTRLAALAAVRSLLCVVATCYIHHRRPIRTPSSHSASRTHGRPAQHWGDFASAAHAGDAPVRQRAPLQASPRDHAARLRVAPLLSAARA